MNSDNIPDPKAKEIINRVADKNGDNSRVYKKFIKFLIDFNIIPFSIGFIISMSISNFFLELTNYLSEQSKFYLLKNKLLTKFVLLCIMIFTIFLFIEYFFYKNVYTKEISAERKLEDVINKNEKDKLQNEINSGHIEKVAKKEISESNDNNNDVIEKFNNLNTNIGLSNFNNNFNNNLNTNTNLELSNFNNNLNTNIEFSNFNKDINNLNTNVNEFTQDRRKFGFADNYDIVNEINKKNLDFNKTYDPKINFTNSINSNINKDINSDNIIEGFNNNIDNFFMI